MKSKKSLAIWNKKSTSFMVNKPKNLREKVIFPCPHCEYHKKRKKKTRLFRKHKLDNISFIFSHSVDNETIVIKSWVCFNCGNELNFEDFPEETKNFINNLFIRALKLFLLPPFLLILKIKSGKEISGKALEASASYKTNQKSIKLICGNCKNSNQFQIIKSKNQDMYQCIKCGKINMLEPKLYDIQNL